MILVYEIRWLAVEKCCYLRLLQAELKCKHPWMVLQDDQVVVAVGLSKKTEETKTARVAIDELKLIIIKLNDAAAYII